MTKKITISVPDELHDKMEKWRNDFNFSKVFQEAMGNLIQKKEDFQKRLKEDPDMNEIIERLKKEKQESAAEWFEIGQEEGLKWAKMSHYDEIQLVLAHDPVSIQDSIFSKLIQFNDNNSDWFVEQIQDIYGFSHHDWPDSEFERGFITGVEKFWNEVKGKI